MHKEVTSDDAPKAPGLLSQAILSNGFIFVAGQIHATADGTLVDGTTEEKLRLVMQNITVILRAAGAHLHDIVKVTIYVTEIAELPAVNAAYATYFSDPFPAREAVCVQALPKGASIEMSVIAAHPA